MTLSTALLKAPHIGVRDLKAHLSQRLKSHRPVIVTDHGEPKQVLMPYEDIVELAEILDELRDADLMRDVRLSRKAAKEGRTGIPISSVFKKIKLSRK